MGIWYSIAGKVQLTLCCADPAGFLSELNQLAIPIEKAQTVDELTITLRISRRNLKPLTALADKRGVAWRITGRYGLYWQISHLRHRPVLVFGLGLLLFLTMYLPTRILFYRIEGNKIIPDRQIIDLAAQAGLHFGSVRREIRSEKVKNALLQAIPELEWAGINTSGCVATISVRERQQTKSPVQTEPVTCIVASRDGIVQEITVTAGKAAVQSGQQVTAGQVLISGYTDCGLSVRAERAKGEVYATTEYSLTLVLPENSAYADDKMEENKKYSLQFRKNRINLSRNSRILDTGCVKMYEENYLTLPGGFLLPLAIVTEHTIPSPVPGEFNPENTLMQAAERYLRSQMIAGTVITREEEITRENGVWRLEGRYVCLEMIGREQSEEIITP